MKKELKERIMRETIVDTRNYRYIYREGNIYRLPIEWLDTTAALDGWTLVK